VILALLFACRPDPGAPSYPDPEPWTPSEDDDFYADPLADGEERLGYGVFYEGEATEALVVDGVDNHFYVYEGTFTVETTDDRWEGYVADELVNTGVGWWGGGVHWDVPRDLSGWETLHFAARTDASASWSVGLTGGGAEARVTVSDYGLVADDAWHVLRVPLADFAAADLTAVTVGLLLVGEGGEDGDRVAIDGVYLTRGGS
jgi:hypothetical protein